MVFDFRLTADREFAEKEIERFKASERRRLMLTGADYYEGNHDIRYRTRTVIGAGGELEPVHNLPDNKVVDNQYRKLVNQKTNYLLGRPLTFRAENTEDCKVLSELLDKRFLRMMKNLCKDAYNHGIAWLYPHFAEGRLCFKRLKGYEVIPGWRDFEHTELDYAIRIYEVLDYGCSAADGCKIVERAEVFDGSGIHYFELDDKGKLSDTEPYHAPYISASLMLDGLPGVTQGERAQALCWGGRIPLVAFRRDSDESPLISTVKSLQDGLNVILSNFWNAMEEDPRNTILVLVNYDGDDLGEFRRNLAAYGAVKVRSVDGANGDLKTLRVEVNAENYRTITDIFKKAIIENGMGFDAKDSRLGGSPNQMNIQSMYSDVDLDANELETEFQAALEELMWFVGGKADFIFNRDMLLNESAVIDNCVKSLGILSRETVIANHPWVDDVMAETQAHSE
jgi:SPP1 family phage portal protein